MLVEDAERSVTLYALARHSPWHWCCEDLNLWHELQAPTPPKEPAKEDPPKFSAFQGKGHSLK